MHRCQLPNDYELYQSSQTCCAGCFTIVVCFEPGASLLHKSINRGRDHRPELVGRAPRFRHHLVNSRGGIRRLDGSNPAEEET